MAAYGTIGRRALLAALVLTAGCGRGDALAQESNDRQVRETLGEVPAVVDTGTAAALSGTFRAAAARALPSVVTINVTARPPQGGQNRMPLPFQVPQQDVPQTGMGSGFVYSDQGHIITNNHVVENASEIAVRFPDGRVYAGAEVVGSDPNTDIAVVKIEPRDGESFTPLEIADSDRLQVGDWVLALGNPLSLGFTVTAGIVSAKGRDLGILQGEIALEAFIQTDAAINRGNSGGPLVDLYGRVVGVNTAIYSPTGTYAGNGFAVPSALAVRAAQDLIEYGFVRRPRIGVSILPVTEAQAELYGLDRISGAYIAEVAPGGPAEAAGLRPEDIVVTLEGDPVRDAAALTTGLARRQPGEEVTLGVIRNGRLVDVDVELDEFEVEDRPRQAAAGRPVPEQTLGFRVAPVESLSPAQRRQLGIGADLEGLVVAEMAPYSPAVGTLQPGDIILEFNRQPVRTARDLERLMTDVDSGDVVVVRIRSVATGNVGVRSFRVR